MTTYRIPNQSLASSDINGWISLVRRGPGEVNPRGFERNGSGFHKESIFGLAH